MIKSILSKIIHIELTLTKLIFIICITNILPIIGMEDAILQQRLNKLPLAPGIDNKLIEICNNYNNVKKTAEFTVEVSFLEMQLKNSQAELEWQKNQYKLLEEKITKINENHANERAQKDANHKVIIDKLRNDKDAIIKDKELAIEKLNKKYETLETSSSYSKSSLEAQIKLLKQKNEELEKYQSLLENENFLIGKDSNLTETRLKITEQEKTSILRHREYLVMILIMSWTIFFAYLHSYH